MSKRYTILVVDDEPDMLTTYENILKKNYNVILSNSANDALKEIEKSNIDLVITDLKMPEKDGIELLKEIKAKFNYLDVIMATASKDIASAVVAMKLGAFDYVTKPFDVNELLAIIDKAFEKVTLVKENLQLKENLKELAPQVELLGTSPQILKIKEFITSIAKTDSTVLITGESGSGKEVAARTIHNLSPRKNNPFIAVNCAAIPENLLESELFGHERGAFTGALERRIGKFELADMGTIFLDEIGCMSPAMQSKLLRIIEEKKFERLGGTSQVEVDIRIISATNIDFENAIKEGGFREDLYYRLNVIPIKMPPLRERIEDIDPLIAFFIGKLNKQFNKNIKSVSRVVLAKLKDYHFPGNVRELQNLMERACALTTGEIIEEENIFGLREGPSAHNLINEPMPSSGLKEAIEDFETRFILKTLDDAKGNQTKAAARLGIARTTLSARLLALGIREKDES